MDSSLVITKVRVPNLRDDLLSRPDLIERLEKGLSNPLTLVSASAGYGKTTLLAELANKIPVAWLSIDEEDNDPVRFWSHFILALQTRQPQKGQSTSKLLVSSALSPTRSLLIDLINEFSQRKQPGKPCILVLDDYHLIEENDIHNDLLYLIEHIPQQLRLIISTRSDPPLPLARMRVRRQISELRTRDLRFSLDEIDWILNNLMNLHISRKDIEILDVRTEGWIASLQMAAISLKKHNDIPAFIKDFTGNQRHVADYLSGEVLNQQTDSIRSFLLETSFLKKLNASLCDTVTGRQDSLEMLKQVDSSNLFLIPLDEDRVWYRYHSLFASLLLSRLKYLHPERLSLLQKRAAEWFNGNDYPDDAIFYALEGGDIDLAAHLISTTSGENYMRAEYRTLLNRLSKLPDEVFLRYPRLAIWYAHIYANKGRIDDAECWLNKIKDCSLSPLEKVHAALPASYIAVASNNDLKAIEILNEMLEHDEKGNSLNDYETGQIITLRFGAVIYLSQLYKSRGQLRQAIETCRTALANFKENQLENPWSAAVVWPHSGLAEFLYEQNELSGALLHAVKSVEIADQAGHRGSQVVGYSVLELINRATTESQSTDRYQNITSMISEMGQSSYENNLCFSIGSIPILLKKLFAERNYESIVQLVKDLEAVVELGQWRKWSVVWPVSTIDMALAYARIAEGKYIEADMQLTALQYDIESSGRNGDLLEVFLLRALVLQAKGNTQQALELLAKAISIAEPEGYFRIFIDMGQPMAALLRQLAARNVFSGFVRRLLAEIDKNKPKQSIQTIPTIEPLTQREIEILKLLSNDLSNQDIAEKLILSIGTIKTHTHHIYAKMGVNNRRQAVKRALDFHII